VEWFYVAKVVYFYSGVDTRVLQLAFLSPKIIEDILSGRQGEGISIHHLRRFGSLPLDWADQAKLLNNLG
jgi:hypothetical protein